MAAPNSATTSTRRTRSATARMKADPGQDQSYDASSFKRRKLTRASNSSGASFFRLLDLPIAIRQHIYGYAIGHRLLHIVPIRRKSLSRSSKAPFTHRICEDDQGVVEQWNIGNISAVPRCSYTTEHDGLPHEKLAINLLRFSKCVYEEARRILIQDNIFAFRDSALFKAFLFQGPSPTMRKESLAKLVIVITPKSHSTHLWNGLLGELYLPHGTMSSPDAHFPSLKSFQLYLTNGTSPPELKGIPWKSPIWIWGFMYFALEDLEAVSVVSKDYAIVDGGTWRHLNEEEQREYEEMIQERLLMEWMGGDQDDIELMHGTYYMKTDDCTWREEGDGALPWGERS